MTDDPAIRTPGQLIAASLAEKGWTQRVLAIVLGMDETGINKLVADKRPVTAPLAVSLEEIFGVPAERFMELQARFDLMRARYAAQPDPQRNVRARIFGSLPVSEMIRRGWLTADDVRDVGTVQAELQRFFGVTALEDIEILPHAPKKTDVASSVTPAQLAWLYRVKQLADEMLVASFTSRSASTAISRISSLLSAPEEARKVPRILAECGIRYVVVETLTGAKIDGVCFWLDDHSPVIGMSLRFDRLDNFWFVLRHELEHLAQGHGKAEIVIDVELEGEKVKADDGVDDERVANRAAAEFCVPREKLQRFIARKAPFFAERDIIGFARTLQIHPGLVAGQLQHETGRYDRFRKHLVPIRDVVLPNAIVDGWGNVAPVGE